MLTYLFDTNIIRYLTKTTTTDEQKNVEWFEKTIRFVDKVVVEVSDGDAESRITDVTESELAIQRFSIGKEKYKEVQNLLNNFGSPLCADYFDTAAINAMKEMVAYLKSAYALKNTYGMDYVFARGGTEDVKILCCAFDLEDCIIVTGNVKDFLIYVILNNNGNVLYDIGAECYVKVPEKLIQDIYSDSQFVELHDKWLNLLENR